MNNNGELNEIRTLPNHLTNRLNRLCDWQPGTDAYHQWAEGRERQRSAFQRGHFIGFTIGGQELFRCDSQGNPDPNGQWWSFPGG